ncbi:MAG: hypothetical protein E7623_08320 [Ruminococcaceae bacterium]|nr:hypothetical protein [Oscillospiraceae bacterium]
MLKLIIGVKGTGKTKRLIQMVNGALESTKGNVVVVEKGDKLIHEIKYTARLIDTDKYSIDTAEKLYGFLAGVCASNYDVTDVFVDGTLKICGSLDAFLEIAEKANGITDHGVNLVVTVSAPAEDIPEAFKKYVIE